MWDGSTWEPAAGSNTIVSDTAPITTNLNEGTLWWNSSVDDGQLYVLYEDVGDPAQGKIWVEAAPSPLDSGPAEVIVSNTAPAIDGLEEGTLWWNSDSSDLQLYVLFNNGTNITPELIWVEASASASGGGELDDEYVNISGDNMTGDLTLGTDKITLGVDGSATFADGKARFATAGSLITDRDDGGSALILRVSGGTKGAIGCEGTLRLNEFIKIGNSVGSDSSRTPNIVLNADGSATFAATVQVGGSAYGTTPTEAGVSLDPDGACVVSRESGSVFLGKQKGVTGPTSTIDADGSATFAADVNVGNRNPGSSSSAGTRIANESGVSGVYTQSNSSVNQSSLAFQALRGTDEIFKVSYDGSAEFTGAINGNSYYGYHDGDTSNSSSMRFNARARDVGGDFQLYDANGTSNRTIYLDGSDGSATFAGNVQVAGFPEDGAADGAVIRSSGAIQASRAAGSTLWAGYTTGTTGFTSQIKADGSASFASQILVGTNTAPTTFAGQYANLIVKGSAPNSNGDGNLALMRAENAASISDNTQIGGLTFIEQGGGAYSWIRTTADGTSTSNSFPGKIELSTTASGDSAPYTAPKG